MPRSKGSTRPIVLNDHDRVAAPAPRCNQLGDVLLGMGIVAGSERWILEAALNVDHQQRALPDHASDYTEVTSPFAVVFQARGT